MALFQVLAGQTPGEQDLMTHAYVQHLALFQVSAGQPACEAGLMTHMVNTWLSSIGLSRQEGKSDQACSTLYLSP